MTSQRRYRLLCPIARALDAVGDRWSLLILRDLHAGPARFQELTTGLGIASNLLSTRLAELTDSGLVEPAGPAGYQLTNDGKKTDRIIWELARFGGGVEPDPDPRPPGNLRTVALPLRVAMESIPDRPELTAVLIVDDAEFTIISSAETVSVEWGRHDLLPDVEIATSYEPLLDVSSGNMSIDEFAKHHVEIRSDQTKAQPFLTLLAQAIQAA